jgi:hypothetical protein
MMLYQHVKILNTDYQNTKHTRQKAAFVNF